VWIFFDQAVHVRIDSDVMLCITECVEFNSRQVLLAVGWLQADDAELYAV